MKSETLTRFQRLQLANDYAILEKVDKENAKDWADRRRIVEEGYTFFYTEIFRPVGNEIPLEDCRFVMDVLEMFEALGSSFKALSDKGDIKPSDVEFSGFGGNDETLMFAYTRYLKDKGLQWRDLLLGCKDLDSHFPMADQYRAMLEKWQELRKQHEDVLRSYRLTKEELQEILDEHRRRIRTAQKAG
jgi:uncharacterized protein YfbU (UPF0304 family)